MNLIRKPNIDRQGRVLIDLLPRCRSNLNYKIIVTDFKLFSKYLPAVHFLQAINASKYVPALQVVSYAAIAGDVIPAIMRKAVFEIFIFVWPLGPN